MVSFEEKDKYVLERLRMVRDQLRGRNISDPAVLDVMSELPREEFIPAAYHLKRMPITLFLSVLARRFPSRTLSH
jgi:hypothetical protein